MDNRADPNLFTVNDSTALATLTCNLRDSGTENHTRVCPPSTFSHQPVKMKQKLTGMPNPTSANLLYRLNGLDGLDSESCTSPGAFQATSSASQRLMPRRGLGQRVIHRQPHAENNHSQGGQPHAYGADASLMELVLWMESLEERMDRFEKTFAG